MAHFENTGLARYRMRLRKLTALTLFLLGATALEVAGERLPIKTYTTADGLARDHINRIVQDSKGFLWFCTSEGLSRFDGYKFINYGTEQGLAGLQVTDFLETKTGQYWAATGKGLCRFIPDALPQFNGGPATPPRFSVYYPGEGASARSINMIYEDHAGAIWCCTDAGLYRVDQSSGEPVFSFVDVIQPARMAENSVRIEAAVEDQRGSLWIIARSGLHRLWPDGTVDRFTAEEGMPAGLSRALLKDRDGRIWVASDLGLFELVPNPKPHMSIVARLYTVKDGLASDRILCLTQAPDGTIWIGTNHGLTALRVLQGKRDGSLQTYTEANGLSRSAIQALCEDRDHNLWMGTDAGGVMRLAATGFVSYDERDGLGKTGRVGSIIEDRTGELCVITDDAISKFEGGKPIAISMTLPAGVSSKGWGWYQITFQDSGGEWWLSTDQGLVRYPKLTSVQQLARARPKAIYQERDGLPTDFIFRLFEDSRRDIWISTLGNPRAVLTRWDRATETFHTYGPPDDIPEAAPTAFCEDSAGNLWIGFYEGGLLRYRDGHFMRFAKSDGAPTGMVRGLYLDHSHRLWIAAADGGVVRVDEPASEHPSFVAYSVAVGLSSNQANCVTEDNWGMMYIGTGRGLDKLDPSTGYIRHYSTADGLANSFVNVSLRYTDGSLWFGTLQGVSRLMPQPDRPSGPPPVFVTALRVAGVPFPIPELGAARVTGPELDADQNNVQIDFSGLNLAAGESLRYQYKLEGASSEWSSPTDQRSISYANIAAGSYRFFVRAVGSDGAVSEPPAVVTFRILAPFWRRWWFIASVLIALAFGLYGIHRYRIARYLEVERIRTRIATDLHDDIGSSLSQVSVLSEVAAQRARASLDPGEPLALIADLSRGLLDSVSDIVWAINPGRDRLSDLTLRMRRFAGDTASAANIEMDFTAPEEHSDLRLSPDVRREVYLIFKESINNLMRHSGCTSAQITVKNFDRSLELIISDNGKGFDQDRAVDGNGLASMRQRAARLGGALEILSGPDGGTLVRLLIPVGRHLHIPRR
jgi:ligand-binding sensor domain-containing protein/signal transduction histidine kinase